MRHSPDYHSAVDMQRILVQAVKGTSDHTLLPKLVQAWDTLTERKRLIKMKPRPKDQEVTKPEPKIKAQPIAEE